ncbi:MAG: hypothetical protein HS049_01390 [Thaumarchaeota archaeon]|jgi:hypothetical protein|nr:hypothetical protein [Nitrososphaerota archaeon]|tara:strand:- start:710 stop:1033 length:324 start_codon:yes stop_codon:yes gene_type:complete
MNTKIEFPIKFQVDVSLTESNISGKIFNDDLEIPIYIKYGEKEILIPEEFQDVGKNIKINFTTENENIVTTIGKTEMNDMQLIQIYDTELWNKMANDNPVSMYMESI